DVQYACVRFSDGWHCGMGTLGYGAVAESSAPNLQYWRDTDPRRFTYVRSINYGLRFGYHFAFDDYRDSQQVGLGAIVRRKASSSPYVEQHNWGLNPNDWYGGYALAQDYIAAMAVKVATGRNGVQISVYNGNGGGLLSDCEAGYRQLPDVGSSGAINGIY